MAETKTRILVVDDDARLRDLLNRYLAEQGYAMRVVHDAADMNRHLARERYDLMILDLMLPGSGHIRVICNGVLQRAGRAINIYTVAAGKKAGAAFTAPAALTPK